MEARQAVCLLKKTVLLPLGVGAPVSCLTSYCWHRSLCQLRADKNKRLQLDKSLSIFYKSAQ